MPRNEHKRVLNELSEAYQKVYTEAVGHYDTHVRLQRGGRWNAHTVNVRKTDKELIKKFLDQGFKIVKPGKEDNEEPKRGITGYQHTDALAQAYFAKKDKVDEEHPRDSMYLKDDPEALKKALAYHRRNVAKLSRKSFADLTDEEYDSLKHSEAELELNEGEEDNEGMSNLEALISSSANEDGELKLDDETDAAEFEINKTQY